ncbi:MAG: hypothetical protein AAGE65_08105 [Planctomycetota bacterium]
MKPFGPWWFGVIGAGVCALGAAGFAWWSLASPRVWAGSTEPPAAGPATEVAGGGVTEYLVFGAPEKLALLDGSMRESSGLAASRTKPGWLWTHGDSGVGPWLMRFDPWHGRPERWTVRGVSHADWEDMASFVLNDRPYLLVADVGDNTRNRDSVALHVLPEPIDVSTPPGSDLASRAPGPAPVLTPALTLYVTYEDGPRDCEAVAVDPASRTVWLVSKEINGRGQMFGRSGLYAVRLPEPADWGTVGIEAVGSAEQPLVLERLATLDTVMPTAMDLTPDGRTMLVGTYGEGLLFERDRSADPDWVYAIAAGPRRVSLPPRRQGEGLCFAVNGDAVFLSSEHPEQPVWRLAVRRGGQ